MKLIELTADVFEIIQRLSRADGVHRVGPGGDFCKCDGLGRVGPGQHFFN